MKNLNELTDFLTEIFQNNYTPGYTSHFDTRRYTLHALGGRADQSVGLEIWCEDYENTDLGDDKRQVFEIDIKVKEIKSER